MKAKIQHEIQEYCSLLRLNAISEHLEEAIASATDYEGFLHQLLRMEVDAEEERAKERKIKAAKFPYRKYIEDLEMENEIILTKTGANPCACFTSASL